MDKGTVNIVLKSTSQGSGITKVLKDTNGLALAIGRLGAAFGTTGHLAGQFLANLVKGGIWGIAQSAVSGLIGLWGKYKEKQEEAAEAVKRKTDEMIDANAKLVASIKETADAQIAATDAALSRREKEIEKVKELTKAEIELARQREIGAAKGDEAAIAAADSKADKMLSEVDMEAAAQKIEERLAAAQEKVMQRRAAEDMAGAAWENAEATNQELRRRYQAAEDEAARKARARAATPAAIGYAPGGFSKIPLPTQEDIDKAAAAAREEFAKGDEGKALLKDIAAHAEGGLKAAAKAREDAKKATAEAENALKDAEDSADLLLKKGEIAAVKEANAKEAADRKAIAEREKAELAAQKQIAAQRLKDEQELHRQRMDNLKKEATGLRTIAAAAQSEFDRAFAMYRDPTLAAEQIAEERDYAADLKQLHKDANRYGGKWRIDELSRLMSAGDTQGVSDTLESWRKSSRFTPQVEAMVRASAAEQTKTTAEDELRKANDKIAKLEEDLVSLSQAQGTKLAAIDNNTAQLAQQIRELLSVKG